MKPNLNTWFKNLDSVELALIFPSKYEEIMMSTDPDYCTINDFVDEARKSWNLLTDEEKEKVYESYLKIQ